MWNAASGNSKSGFCPGVRVHKGITIAVLSLFRSYWLAVVYCVLCSGSCEPVHEDRTRNRRLEKWFSISELPVIRCIFPCRVTLCLKCYLRGPRKVNKQRDKMAKSFRFILDSHSEQCDAWITRFYFTLSLLYSADMFRWLKLELRICTPTIEIPLILGGTGQRFRACGGEGAPLVI